MIIEFNLNDLSKKDIEYCKKNFRIKRVSNKACSIDEIYYYKFLNSFLIKKYSIYQEEVEGINNTNIIYFLKNGQILEEYDNQYYFWKKEFTKQFIKYNLLSLNKNIDNNLKTFLREEIEKRYNEKQIHTNDRVEVEINNKNITNKLKNYAIKDLKKGKELISYGFIVLPNFIVVFPRDNDKGIVCIKIYNIIDEYFRELKSFDICF